MPDFKSLKYLTPRSDFHKIGPKTVGILQILEILNIPEIPDIRRKILVIPEIQPEIRGNLLDACF